MVSMTKQRNRENKDTTSIVSYNLQVINILPHFGVK